MVDGKSEREIFRERVNLKNAAQWVRNCAIENSRSDGRFVVTEKHICELHFIIADGTSIETPGEYRKEQVIVGKNRDYIPPEAKKVKPLMKEFVSVLNQDWEKYSVTRIAAFTLWKINWIHPFNNGNGRTSRLFSYLLMNMKAGHAPLPGKEGFLVHENLADEYRPQYVEGLRQADNNKDLSHLENLITKLLHSQLVNLPEL